MNGIFAMQNNATTIQLDNAYGGLGSAPVDHFRCVHVALKGKQ